MCARLLARPRPMWRSCCRTRSRRRGSSSAAGVRRAVGLRGRLAAAAADAGGPRPRAQRASGRLLPAPDVGSSASPAGPLEPRARRSRRRGRRGAGAAGDARVGRRRAAAGRGAGCRVRHGEALAAGALRRADRTRRSARRGVHVRARRQRRATRRPTRLDPSARSAAGRRSAVIDLAGAHDARRRWPACCSLAAACVSNDSGAMHLAGAVGTPLVALFGPTREYETAPLTAPGGRVGGADQSRLVPALHAARVPDRSPVHERADAGARASTVARALMRSRASMTAGRVPRSRRHAHRRARLSRSPGAADALSVDGRCDAPAEARRLRDRRHHQPVGDRAAASSTRRFSTTCTASCRRDWRAAARAIDRYYYCPHHPDAPLERVPSGLPLPEAGPGHDRAGVPRDGPRSGPVGHGRRSLARRRLRPRRRARAPCWCGPATARHEAEAPPAGARSRCYPQQFDGGRWLDSAQLLALIDALEGRTVAVIGDVVADEFVYGRVARVSREAPVLILEYDSTEIVPGGAGNAANNVAALGGRAGAGRRRRPRRVRPAAAGGACTGASTRAGVRAAGRRGRRSRRASSPAASIRPSSRWCGSIAASARPIDARARARVRARGAGGLAERRRGAGVRLRVGPGDAGARARESSRALRRAGHPIPVLIDSRYRLLDYRGLTACTPNESEVEQALGVRINDDPRHARARRPRDPRADGDAGGAHHARQPRHGAVRAGAPTVHIPIFGSDEIADVTGAGDTVMATHDAGAGRRGDVRGGGAAGELRRRPGGDEARHGHRVERASCAARAAAACADGAPAADERRAEARRESQVGRR